MALATLNELRAAITDYTTRTDVPVTTCIALAESKFASTVKHRLAEKFAEIPVAANAPSFPLPVDFQEARSLKIEGKPLTLASIDALNAVPGNTGEYAIVGTTVRLQSQPAADLLVGFTYYARVPALTESNITNWLLATFPDVYLYGVLLEYAIWAQDTDKQAAYGTLLAAALGNLNLDHARGSFSGSTLRTRRFT